MTTTDTSFLIPSMMNPNRTEREPYVYRTQTEHESILKVLRTGTEPNPYHQRTRTVHEPKI